MHRSGIFQAVEVERVCLVAFFCAHRMDRKHHIDLSGARAWKIRCDHFGFALVVVPSQHTQQHGRVMHKAFTMAFGGVLGQHGAKSFPIALLPQLNHVVVELF